MFGTPILGYAPNHFDCDAVPIDRRSKVILTKHAPKSLVVFVHGFRGDALETWQPFDQMTISRKAFADSDILFFGYDAYYSNVLASASFLFDLLDQVTSSPAALVGTERPALVAARAAGYERVILTAHSLGAVVSRWAILRAVEEQRAWCAKLRLLLFAPAHTGSDLATMATSAVSGFSWLSLFVEAAKAKVPLVKELEPTSRILTELAERVRTHDEPCLRANRVVVAEHEIVVSNLPFPGDPCPDALRDTDHVSVCKPSLGQDRAVTFLEELLR
jgi:hypothetical protein